MESLVIHPEDILATLMNDRKVRALLQEILPDRDSQREVIQKALIAGSKLTVNPDLSFAAWLRTVVRNLALKERRSQARRRKYETEAGVTALSSVARDKPNGPDWSSVDTRELLLGAILSLPETQRDVILLRIQGELSVDETAVALGVPKATVRSRLRRARRALRSVLHRRFLSLGAGALTISDGTISSLSDPEDILISLFGRFRHVGLVRRFALGSAVLESVCDVKQLMQNLEDSEHATMQVLYRVLRTERTAYGRCLLILSWLRRPLDVAQLRTIKELPDVTQDSLMSCYVDLLVLIAEQRTESVADRIARATSILAAIPETCRPKAGYVVATGAGLIAHLHMYREEFQEAGHWLAKARSLTDRFSLTSLGLTTRVREGIYYIGIGDFGSAESVLQCRSTRALLSSLGEVNLLAYVHVLAAQCAIELSDYETSAIELASALELTHRDGNTTASMLGFFYEMLSAHLWATGSVEQAWKQSDRSILEYSKQRWIDGEQSVRARRLLYSLEVDDRCLQQEMIHDLVDCAMRNGLLNRPARLAIAESWLRLRCHGLEAFRSLRLTTRIGLTHSSALLSTFVQESIRHGSTQKFRLAAVEELVRQSASESTYLRWRASCEREELSSVLSLFPGLS